MANEVKIKVDLDDKKAQKGLDELENKAKGVGNNVGDTTKKITDGIGNETKKNENYLSKLQNFGNRVATSLLNDFKALASINALQGAMKFSSIFGQSISESVELSDVIRKLGTTLGIARQNFDSFAGTMTKGLGEIGLSSEVASNALKGLVDTPVRGEKALLEYSKISGQLASISMEQGREGDIAKGLANAIKARGGDVNDVAQISALADEVKRVRAVTGRAASETISSMSEIFGAMPSEIRKKVGARGLSNLAAAEQVAGPGSAEFIKLLLTQGTTANSVFKAQGFGNVFNDQGLDIEKFRQAAQGVLSRVGGDTTLAARTLGISDDETAKGFVRLVESLDKVKEAQDAISKSNESLTQTYKSSMTLGESFRANLNRIKSFFAEPISGVTGFATRQLQQASEGDATAGAVVAGSGILAAVLAGGALKGIGGGLLGGLAKGAAAENVTGKKTIPVYVVNAAEIAAGGLAGGLGPVGGAAGGAAGGLAGKLLGVAGVGVAGAAGFGLGSILEPAVTGLLNEKTTGKTQEGFEGNILERVFFKLDALLGGDTSKQFAQQQKMLIELKSQELKKTPKNSRGPSM